MHWISSIFRSTAMTLLVTLGLSIVASCDMVVSVGVLEDLLGVPHVHDSESGIVRCDAEAEHGTRGANSTHAEEASCDEASCDECDNTSSADGCCGTEGGDDCALPCWYCGCAHSFSSAVTAAAPTTIPLLVQGSVPDLVASILATDRPRLIHPPSIA